MPYISACDPSSLFQFSRWSANMAPRYSQKRPSAILNLENFDFLLNVHHGNWNVHLHTKFDRNRIILGWDMEIMRNSRWRPSARCLEFAKIAVLVMWPISACHPSSLFQISCWSANMAPSYSQKMIFNMASIHHLGFVMTSSYCIQKLYFTFPILS